MKYVQINTVPTGSIGSVMRRMHSEQVAAGNESWMMWGRGRAAENDCEFNFGSKAGVYLDVLLTRLDGRAGFHSKAATRRLLAKLDEIDPDVVHLHNIHGYYVNVEMLFEWLAAHRCQVKWTLHDCWAFTGHCAHFTYVGCEQWKRRCGAEGKCPQLRIYPKTLFNGSCTRNFDDKKPLFNLIPQDRLEIITPSQWLAGIVGESFLSKYLVTVKRNEIDRTVFKPTPSDFRKRYGLEGKFIILGVASPWTERKGLGDFLEFIQELDSDRFATVLVGLSRKQIKQIGRKLAASPRGESVTDYFKGSIVELKGGGLAVLAGRVEGKEKLAEVYTAADIFFNPTREDNYPSVNLEAQSCGTRVITYDVGGCRETLMNLSCDGLPEVISDADLGAACLIVEDLSGMRSDRKTPSA